MGAEDEQDPLPATSTHPRVGGSREDGGLDHRVATGGQMGEIAKRYSGTNLVKG